MSDAGRIAMRVEGEMWVGYWAPSEHSMQDAILIGSIRMNLVTRNPARKEAFLQMMRESVSEIAQRSTGAGIEWNSPTPAPEHERSGRG